MECPSVDGGVKSQTPKVTGFAPTWTEGGCTTTLGELLSESIELEVVDVDFTFDDVMLDRSVQLTQEDFIEGSLSLELLEQDAGVLKVTLTRSP